MLEEIPCHFAQKFIFTAPPTLKLEAAARQSFVSQDAYMSTDDHAG